MLQPVRPEAQLSAPSSQKLAQLPAPPPHLRSVPLHSPLALQLSFSLQYRPSSQALPTARLLKSAGASAGLHSRHGLLGSRLPAARQAPSMTQLATSERHRSAASSQTR